MSYYAVMMSSPTLILPSIAALKKSISLYTLRCGCGFSPGVGGVFSGCGFSPGVGGVFCLSSRRVCSTGVSCPHWILATRDWSCLWCVRVRERERERETGAACGVCVSYEDESLRVRPGLDGSCITRGTVNTHTHTHTHTQWLLVS